jgi:hypothetical protein
MSVQNTNPKSDSGFLHSVGGQTLIFVIVAAIIIVAAWRYIF